MEKKMVDFHTTICDFCNRIEISMKKKEVWCPELKRALEYRCDMSELCDASEDRLIRYNLENPRFNLEIEEIHDCPLIRTAIESLIKNKLSKTKQRKR